MQQVNSRTSIPVYSCSVATAIACLLSLIAIGSPTVFDDMVSLTISCLLVSYLNCCILLLYRRCTGSISHSAVTDDGIINTTGAELVWGPYHIPGILGISVNIIAIIFMIIATFFSFWPPGIPVTVSNMNYSSVGFSCVVIFSLVYYFVSARKVYTGPVVEIEPG